MAEKIKINPRAFVNQSNYRLACLTERVAFLMRAVAGMSARGRVSDPSAWRHGVILGDHHIGDVLVRSGSLPALKQALPDCKWSYVAAPMSAGIVQNNPYIDAVLPIMDDARDYYWNAEMVRILRRGKFDVALCTNTVTSWPFLTAAVCAGIPNRVGFVFKGFSGWVTLGVPTDWPLPYAGYFKSIVKYLGRANSARNLEDWPLRPQVFCTHEDETQAEECWNGLRLPTANVIMCFIASRQPHGQWPVEKFVEVCSILRRRRPDVSLVLCGGRGDHEALTGVQRQVQGSVRVVAGTLGLRSLVCFLKKAKVVLSTDSGPRHLANAAGVPVVFFRNLWADKVESGVYCATEYDMAPDVERVPPESQADWFDRVQPEIVAQKVISLLSRENVS